MKIRRTRKFQHTTWNSQSRIMQHERVGNIKPYWMLEPMQFAQFIAACGSLPRRQPQELANV